MLFNSYIFLFFFLPLVLFGFFKIGGKGKSEPAIAWLILSSFIFYSWWNPVYLPLLVFSIVFNYGMARLLRKRTNFLKSSGKILLALGVGVDLGLIAYFKYYNFFITSMNHIVDSGIETQSIVLPLAISFFTFQQISYLIDAYRGETEDHNFLHYCCFISFFPQLIAGPIVQHNEMLPQLSRQNMGKINGLDMAVGITVFTMGLFKKVVIADSLALIATPVFTKAEMGMPLHFFAAWKGAVSYSFQLYFDFSGYSDMAIGLGRMFGIRLPLNFHSPYRAVSIIDFWKRWHITLSRFLQNYLYIPLGGNQKGRFRQGANLMVTMLLGGLWHGAGWTFILWGGIHGLFLIVNHIWKRLCPITRPRWWYTCTARFVTFICVTLAWVFFRAESFSGAMTIFKGMMNLPNTFKSLLGTGAEWLILLGFQFNGPGLALSHYGDLLLFIIWLIFLWVCPNTLEWTAVYEPALKSNKQVLKDSYSGRWKDLLWHPKPVWGWILGIIGTLSIMHLAKPSEFLYFQF